MRQLLQLLVVLSVVGDLVPSVAAERPNVLLVITDDQGYGDFSAHGNPVLQTPVLDRLAAESIRFDRFFVSPLCAPTRASLLTGRYSLRTGTRGVAAGDELMRSEEVTIAEALRDAGYRTGLFGKWHNGEHYPNDPRGQGFQEVLGYNLGHWNNYFDTTLLKNGLPQKTQGYIVDVIGEAATNFMQAKAREPFFCYVAFTTPHSPHQVPDAYFERYKAKGLTDELACIYGMCANLDDNVGRLLKCLDEQGLRENTIVVFLTDNGPNGQRFNAGMRGAKGTLHEGGSRVPLFVRWPARFKEPRLVQPIAAHLDVFPTLIELCGVPMPKTLPQDGRSLVPLMEGKTDGWPDRTFVQQHMLAGPKGATRAAVRTQRYRAVKEGPQWELFDMQSDPAQTTNVAVDRADVLRAMQRDYDDWWREVEPQARQPRGAIHVGHLEAPFVEINVPLSKFSGGLKFNGKHPNNAWLNGWTSLDGQVSYDLEVVRGGDYRIELAYLCAEKDAGSKIEVRAGNAKASAIVKSTAIKQVPSPDRVPRGEVYEMEWATLDVGALRLETGPTTLTLQALTKPGEQVMELKAVRIVRRE